MVGEIYWNLQFIKLGEKKYFAVSLFMKSSLCFFFYSAQVPSDTCWQQMVEGIKYNLFIY